MSKCPDMATLEKAIYEFYDDLESIIELKIYYIGNEEPNLPFKAYSLHGQAEAIGNIFKICLYK